MRIMLTRFALVCFIASLFWGFAPETEAQTSAGNKHSNYGIGTLNRRRETSGSTTLASGADGHLVLLEDFSKSIIVYNDGGAESANIRAIGYNTNNVTDSANATTTCDASVPIVPGAAKSIDGEFNALLIRASGTLPTMTSTPTYEVLY